MLDLIPEGAQGGRFELGIGAGGYLGPAHAMGAPALTPRESLEALERSIARRTRPAATRARFAASS